MQPSWDIDADSPPLAPPPVAVTRHGVTAVSLIPAEMDIIWPKPLSATHPLELPRCRSQSVVDHRVALQGGGSG
jgi:hypothetical protein